MKTMRIIVLACSLAVLMMADHEVLGEEVRAKTTAELIAEVEGSPGAATTTSVVDNKTVKTTAELIAEVEASSGRATVTPVVDNNTVKTTDELIAEVEAASKAATETSAVDENAPKSAAEIMAEIEALSRPSQSATAAVEIDEKQLASATQVASETGEELPIDSDPLPDEVVGEFAVDDSDAASGTETIVVTEVADATDTIDLSDIENAAASGTESLPEEAIGEGRFEKADALEPHLLLAGTPADEEAEAQVSEKLSGRIIAEKHPLTRRRHMYRWVLKTADGLRIPLKSNIKLLQEVRRDEILDSQVNLTGKFVHSGYDDKLRYFVVESVVLLDADKADEKKAESKSKKAVDEKKK